MECKAMRLAGAHEVRDLLGVSRQRVYQLAARSDFPKPVATLAQGKIWSIDDIEKWLADHRGPRAAALREARLTGQDADAAKDGGGCGPVGEAVAELAPVL